MSQLLRHSLYKPQNWFWNVNCVVRKFWAHHNQATGMESLHVLQILLKSRGGKQFEQIISPCKNYRNDSINKNGADDESMSLTTAVTSLRCHQEGRHFFPRRSKNRTTCVQRWLILNVTLLTLTWDVETGASGVESELILRGSWMVKNTDMWPHFRTPIDG